MIRVAFAVAACLLVAAPAVGQVYVVPDEGVPMPPAGAAPGFVPPPRDAEGAYRTPNRGLSADEATWHLRVALNVAALGCRGVQDGDTPRAYAVLLEMERAPLAVAYTATRAGYRLRRTAAAADAAYDEDMTRLYNFFAQPPAHEAFCAAAHTVLDETSGVAPAEFARFAPQALAALEAPFLRHYAAYDAYREALAGWRQRHAPVVIATAAPVAYGPLPPTP